MARTVRDSRLETREVRLKLSPRGKPYYKAIDEGLHVGYRKPRSGAGKWVVRQYTGGQSYEVETIATADDISDANAANVLNFSQAQRKARALRDGRARADAGLGPYTVNDAMVAYIAFLEDQRKSATDAQYRYDAFIKGPLGDIEVSRLDADKIAQWHTGLTKLPPRIRTARGEEQRYGKLGKDEQSKRRRRVSANRTLITLRAALTMAWRNKKVDSNTAWGRVKPYKNVNVARIRYLTVAEAKRLINACEPDFRRLVQAALETGARYSELAQLQVHDFNRDAGTVAVATSKSGRPRHIVLTDEGRTFFKQACAGRSGGDLMFTTGRGLTWGRSHQTARMDKAVKRAKISPAIGFHGLRHTWASLAVMAGVPLLVVAKNLGHSDTRMVERHYGHLAPSYIADAIRAGAPRFGFKPDKKIAELV